VASAGSSAARMARITATPAAPAARVSGTPPAVTPPIASTGTRAAAAAWRSAATPCGGPNAAFDGVAYTGPKKMKSAVALAASAGACVDTPTSAPGHRDVDPVVHQQERAGARGQHAQPVGQGEQRAAGEILVTQLYRGQPGVERGRHHVDEVATGGGVTIGDQNEPRWLSG
jgi:hypothetical protein